MASHHRGVVFEHIEEMSGDLATTAEMDDDAAEMRLRNLYPHVDTRKTPLPTSWNRLDKWAVLHLTDMNLRVYYPEREQPDERKNTKDAASVRANAPIPIFCGIYYFEVNIQQSDGFMGIGVCEKQVNLNRLPGWDRYSYGYHGDDGNFFSCSGQGTNYGPKYGTRDVIGCGVNLIRKTIFFTKNGQNLGNAQTLLDEVKELFPTVGLQTPNGTVDVNFGQNPFLYDIYRDMMSLRENMGHAIRGINLPSSKSAWLNNCISSWLASEGHSKTLSIFSREAHAPMEEEESSVENRKEIARLIMTRRSRDAYALIEKNYPTLLSRNKELELDLRAQRFIEWCAELAEPGRRPCGGWNGNGAAHSFPDLILPSHSANGASSSAPCSSRTAASLMHSAAAPSSSTASPRANPLKRRSSTSQDEVAASVADILPEGPAARRPPSQTRPPTLSTQKEGRPPRRSTRGRQQQSTAMEVDESLAGPSATTPSSSSSVSTDISPTTPSSAVSTHVACSSKNGTSSANGKEKGKKEKGGAAGESATTIVEEDTADGFPLSLADEEEDERLRCGYTRAEAEEYDQFEPLIEEGTKIDIAIKTLSRSGQHSEKVLNNAKLATAALFLKYESEFADHELMGDNRLRCLSKLAHSCILQYLGRSADSKLVKLERLARKDKEHLYKMLIPAAPFVDYDLLVLGREKERLREKGGGRSGGRLLQALPPTLSLQREKPLRAQSTEHYEQDSDDEDSEPVDYGEDEEEEEEGVEEEESDEEMAEERVEGGGRRPSQGRPPRP